MDKQALNRLIYDHLEIQCNNIFRDISEPLFLQYGKLLQEYKEGRVIFDTDEDTEAFLEERATDLTSPNPYAAYIEETTIDETSAIQNLRQQLTACFSDIAIREQLQKSGAVSISCDWYFHFVSGMNFFKKGLTYPIILEPRYLNQDLPPGHYDGFTQGPDFTGIWPDCSALIEEYEEEDTLDLGSKLMSYYQHRSRLYLHKALYEMEMAGELAFINYRPFLFYVAEHDLEDMTLYRIAD